MGWAALAARQVRYEQRSFWRNPASAFFTVVFPVVFLVILGGVFRSSRAVVAGGSIPSDDYYIPTLVAFGVMGACFTNIAITTSMRRDTGLLKRLRGTPLPGWAYLAGLLGSSVIISLVLVVVTTGFGMLVYGAHAPRHPAALVLALAVGALAFCALGLATSALIPNADSAPAVVNVVFLPLVLLSGTFFVVPPDSLVSQLASLFPVRHFSLAVLDAFDPAARLAGGLSGGDLAVMVAWGLLGVLVALRRFRWDPPRH